jgi:hypothetical protein
MGFFSLASVEFDFIVLCLAQKEIFLKQLSRYTSLSTVKPKTFIRHGTESVLSTILKKTCGFSPQANYTDRATASCQRS